MSVKANRFAGREPLATGGNAFTGFAPEFVRIRVTASPRPAGCQAMDGGFRGQGNDKANTHDKGGVNTVFQRWANTVWTLDEKLLGSRSKLRKGDQER